MWPLSRERTSTARTHSAAPGPPGRRARGRGGAARGREHRRQLERRLRGDQVEALEARRIVELVGAVQEHGLTGLQGHRPGSRPRQVAGDDAAAVDREYRPVPAPRGSIGQSDHVARADSSAGFQRLAALGRLAVEREGRTQPLDPVALVVDRCRLPISVRSSRRSGSHAGPRDGRGRLGGRHLPRQVGHGDQDRRRRSQRGGDGPAEGPARSPGDRRARRRRARLQSLSHPFGQPLRRVLPFDLEIRFLKLLQARLPLGIRREPSLQHFPLLAGHLAQAIPLEEQVGETGILVAHRFSNDVRVWRRPRSRQRTPDTDRPTSAATSSSVSPSR